MVQYGTKKQVTSAADRGETVTTTQRQEPAAVPDEHPQVAYRQKKTIFRTYQIVWYILGFLEIILAFRFLLKALGANPASGFASLIYGLSHPFVLPFSGLFRMTASGRYAVEWTTIIAMLVYPILAYGILKLLQIIKPTTPEEVERTVDTA